VLRYLFPGESGHLIFTKEVIDCFIKHRQLGPLSREFGGQLFARFVDTDVIIERVTGLRKGDKRGRFHFLPSRKAEQNEINCMFKEELHYIGDWHTHPQNKPLPSQQDISSMENAFLHSHHELKAFIMVIIGRDNPPDGIWVSNHCNRGYERMILE